MKGIYKCPVFKGLEENETEILLHGKLRSKKYDPGEIIAFQGDIYRSLFIVDSGLVRGEMTNFAGDSIIIEEIESPRSIAPAILYATDNTLPVDVVAVTETNIISIHRNDFTHILQSDPRVLHNFMQSISDRSKFLSDRVRMLRFGTIKSKLAGYLLERMQQKGRSDFEIPHTHHELADMFGVTRPSLSRALGEMVKTGIIHTHRKNILIQDREALVRLFKNI